MLKLMLLLFFFCCAQSAYMTHDYKDLRANQNEFRGATQRRFDEATRTKSKREFEFEKLLKRILQRQILNQLTSDHQSSFLFPARDQDLHHQNSLMQENARKSPAGRRYSCDKINRKLQQSEILKRQHWSNGLSPGGK